MTDLSIRTLVIGANVAGSAFRLWLARLSPEASGSVVCIDQRAPEQCGRKPCGSGLTAYARRLFEWEPSRSVYPAIGFQLEDRPPVDLFVPPLLFTTRERLLRHLDRLRQDAQDRSD